MFAELASGKRVQRDSLLYVVARQANGDLLRLEATGLACDSRGKVSVNEHFQTSMSHIYAAGDVIGFPALVPQLPWSEPLRASLLTCEDEETARAARRDRRVHVP